MLACPLWKESENLAHVILRTIEILDRENAKYRPIQADVVIKPELYNVTSTQLNRAAEIIEAGRAAAEAQLDEVISALRGVQQQAN